ncbi:MAG: DUF1559 domain-containing protein [Pirellulales bacterium]|nr:DUF1559 domain-containing protein [Pirellulales bacterium]
MQTETRTRRAGFTLVELLVVIAIIGILIALLLPAIQAAREAARRIRCQNQIKQMALACLEHENALKHLPTAGWSYQYVGDPDRGAGKHQPGGWVYGTLPYLEQQAVHDLGKGMTGAAKRTALMGQMQAAMPMQNCPSRRNSEGYRWSATYTLINIDTPAVGDLVARTDYAGNGGDTRGTNPRPVSYAEGDKDSFWPDTSELNGLFYPRSTVKLRDVTDGTTQTFLLGEKYLNPDDYDTGADPGDNQSMYQGYDVDTVRFTGLDTRDPTSGFPPVRDTRGYMNQNAFGSAHPSVCNFAMLDGSVRSVQYEIDITTYRQMGNSRDGHTVDETAAQ